MGQISIKTLFREGRYEEAINRVDKQQFISETERFEAECYKTLIYCLRGDITNAKKLISQIQHHLLVNQSQKYEFILITLKTMLRSYQGNEKEFLLCYNEGKVLLAKLNEEKRSRLAEWEAWFQFGMGTFNFLSLRFDKPIQNHFDEALELLDQIPEKGGKEWIYLFSIFFYMDSRNLEEGEESYQKLKSFSLEKQTYLSQIFVKMAEGISWAFKGDREKARSLYEHVLPIMEKEQLFILSYLIYHGFGVLSYFQGDFEKAKENYKIAIKLSKEKGFYFSVAWLMLVSLYFGTGEYEDAFTLMSQLLKINETNTNKGEIAQTIRIIGAIYFYQGNFKGALEKTEESLKLSLETKSKRLQVLCFNNLGYFFYSQGKLEQAIQHYHQALNFAKELHKSNFALYGKYSLSMGIQTTLAEMYAIMGEFDLGLELLQDSLDRTRGLKVKEADGFVFYPGAEADLYLNIGKFHFRKAEYSLAKISFKKSLNTLSIMYENPLFSVDALFNLVLTCCELDELDEAQIYFNQLEESESKTKNVELHHQILIAKGILFKTNPRLIKKAQAQKIFQNVLSYEDLSLDLRVYVLLNLIQILAWELSSTGHKTVLQEIEQILKEIREIAGILSSITLEIEVGIIQSQFELIQGDVKAALERLDGLTLTAIDNDLEKYQERIEEQQETIQAELTKWIELTEQNAPLVARIQKSQVEDYIATALRLVKGPGQDEKIKVPGVE